MLRAQARVEGIRIGFELSVCDVTQLVGKALCVRIGFDGAHGNILLRRLVAGEGGIDLGGKLLHGLL